MANLALFSRFNVMDQPAMHDRRNRAARGARTGYASGGSDARRHRARDGSVGTVQPDCADDYWPGHDQDVRMQERPESFEAAQAPDWPAQCVPGRRAMWRWPGPTIDRYRDAICVRNAGAGSVRSVHAHGGSGSAPIAGPSRSDITSDFRGVSA